MTYKPENPKVRRTICQQADARMRDLAHQHGGQGPTRTSLCRACAVDCEWTGERWVHVYDRTPACSALMTPFVYTK